jgi:hypothetical protein
LNGLAASLSESEFYSRPFFEGYLWWKQDAGVDECAVAALKAFPEGQGVVYSPLHE